MQKVRQGFRLLIYWVDRLQLLWLILVVPLLLFPTPKRSLALLVIPGSWLLRWWRAHFEPHPVAKPDPTAKITQPPLPVTPFNPAILVLASMVLLNLWVTPDLTYSLPKISGMVLAFGVFFTVARQSQTTKGWYLTLLIFAVSGFSVAALGFLGTDWITDRFEVFNPLIFRLPRLISGFKGAESGFNPNEVAGALTWVLPLFVTMSVFFFPKRLVRINHQGLQNTKVLLPELINWQMWALRTTTWLATTFMIGVFILTQSRGSYVAVTLTFLILLFFIISRRRRRLIFGSLLVAGLVLGAALPQDSFSIFKDWTIGKGLANDFAFSTITLEGRLYEIWPRAVDYLRNYPWTGVGMNIFRKVVRESGPPLILVPADLEIAHSHNEFFQVGLDLGIPGLVAFVSLYMLAFWMLVGVWKSIQHLQPGSYGITLAAVLGLGGGLFAHFLYSLVDAVALGAKPGFLFWMLLGLVAGLYTQYDLSRTILNDPKV